GKYGGIATVCAALVVFVLVNVAIFGGLRRSTPASEIPEMETPQETGGEDATLVAQEPTGEEAAGEEPTTAEDTMAEGEEPTTAEDITNVGEETADAPDTVDEALREKLQNVLGTAEYASVYDIPAETQKELFSLLTDYLPIKEEDVFMSAGMMIRWQSEHTGIDMACDNKTAAIYMVMDGTILETGWKDTRGLSVLIDNGSGVTTEYSYLSEITCSVGDVLKAGAQVGCMGSTGDSTGPHLHWQMTLDGDYVNPLCFAAEHLELFHRDQ
ncbi:MAG: M23 family metallopeptidase, partial [Alistipes sp.]|nr:M23 family metallopeptidase [Alistipes sp.]